MNSCDVPTTPPPKSLLQSFVSQNKFTLETKRSHNLITDRYIPKKLDFDAFAFRNIFNVAESSPVSDKPNLNETLKKRQSLQKYQNILKRNLSRENNKGKILNYFDQRKKKEGFLFGEDNDAEEVDAVRSIARKPYKLLEAPKLKDDFYYNILDWSKTDLIATSLNNTVYMWTGRQNDAQKIADGRVSCVKFSQQNLAVGDEVGQTKIYDLTTKKIVGKLNNHFGRIGTIDFNNSLMVTGSKDQRVIVSDLRSNKIVSKFDGHKQQVCGVKWSFDGNHLASGGNDNKVFIWSTRMNKEIGKISDHSAAVKGLAWSPHKHSILATGGGTSDKTIKIWNTSDMSLVHNIDSGSQVCNMMFSQNTNQLVTTHGYSLNTICVWRQRDMKKIATLHGHSYRVLYLAMSPDGQNIVSGSGDQTLRFWKVFPSKSSGIQMGSNLDSSTCTIR